jgi:hypothetical protein
VTLMKPAPLDADLDIRVSGEEAALYHGGELLASAQRSKVQIDVPSPPSLDTARDAESRFAGLEHHLYPGCFVCGPERQSPDGWRIFPGEVAPGHVAATWTATKEFAEGGAVKPEFVWAALDCPGYFAVREPAGLALLGRMAVVIHEPLPMDEPLVVQGWAMGSDGRKHRAGTAIHGAEGGLLAAAAQTWVTLR